MKNVISINVSSNETSISCYDKRYGDIVLIDQNQDQQIDQVTLLNFYNDGPRTFDFSVFDGTAKNKLQGYFNNHYQNARWLPWIFNQQDNLTPVDETKKDSDADVQYKFDVKTGGITHQISANFFCDNETVEFVDNVNHFHINLKISSLSALQNRGLATYFETAC